MNSSKLILTVDEAFQSSNFTAIKMALDTLHQKGVRDFNFYPLACKLVKSKDSWNNLQSYATPLPAWTTNISVQ